MKSPDERRKRIRIPVQSRIKHSLYQVLGTPVFEENSTVDWSSGGLSFETTREYQKGNLVLLEVVMSEEPLKLLVCVAWVKTLRKDGIYQVGAELIAIDPVHKRKMIGHLNELIDKIESKKRPGKKKIKKKPVKKTKKKSSSMKAKKKPTKKKRTGKKK
jgi:Tfp pilus assembly protein PilZ